MFGFGGGGDSKKDDSKLGFGLPSLSLGNAGGVIGKASNTVRNTGKKVESFLFGHHGKNEETNTETSEKDHSNLGFGLPRLSLGNAREGLGKASNTVRNTGKKVENFVFGHHGRNTETNTETSEKDHSKLGFGLPRLSLGNARNTGKKVESFVFGHHGKNTETNTETSEKNLGKLGFGLPSISLGNANGVLGKASATISNTGKKVENFLFGHHGRTTETYMGATEKDSSKLGFGLPNLSLGNAREGLQKASNTMRNTGEKVEKFLFGHHGGTTETNSETSEKAEFKLGLGLPSLSLGNAREGLENASNTMRNTGEKVEKFLLGHHDGTTETNTETSGKAEFKLGLGLPSLSLGNAREGLGNASNTMRNTGEKVENFLLGHHGRTTEINTETSKKEDSKLGFGLPTLSLGNAGGVLGKASNTIRNTGEKVEDFLFGHHGSHTESYTDTSGVTLGLGGKGGISIGVNTVDGSNINGTIGLPKLPIGRKIDITIGSKEKSMKPAMTAGINHPKVEGSITGDLGGLTANNISIGVSLGGSPNLSSKANNTAEVVPTNSSVLGSNMKVDVIEDIDKNVGKNMNVSTGLPNLKLNGKIGGGLAETPSVNLSLTELGGIENVHSMIGKDQAKFNNDNKNISDGNGQQINMSNNSSVKLGGIGGHPKIEGSITGDLGGLKANNMSIGVSLDELPYLSPKKTNIAGTVATNTSESGSKMQVDVNEVVETTENNSGGNMNGSTILPNLKLDEKIGGGKFNTDNKNITEGEGKPTNSSNKSEEILGGTLPSQNGSRTDNYPKPTTPSIIYTPEISIINTPTESSSIFTEESDEQSETSISSSNNIPTESENSLKKIYDILRGRTNVNSSTRPSIEINTRKEEDHVIIEEEYWTPSAEITEPVHNSTLDYAYKNISTTERTKKSKPAILPPYFLVPNSNATFGEQSPPVLPPSVFDNPTGKKAPFIPVLPSSTNNPMGIYNLTDRGVNSNPTNSSQQSDDLSAVAYGAIGVGTIAFISIIITLIYKAIKRASSRSAGGSYSPNSQHRAKPETRRSSSSSEDNEANRAISDSPIEQTDVTHVVLDETFGEANLAKKNIRNVKSRAPDPQKNANEVKNTKTESDLNNQEESNVEISDTKLKSQELSVEIKQDEDMKREKSTDAVETVYEQQHIPKKNVPSINKPPRKIDKAIIPTEKFTSDKTAASNMNEGSLRSLGQALGGILKNQIPEFHGNQKTETPKVRKEVKDFGNDSAELISSTPPTTPTDLSDQEMRKNDKRVEDHKATKASDAAGGDTEVDAFFSSGEVELDTGSDYFSADESSYATKGSNAVNNANTVPNCHSGNSNPNQGNHILEEKDTYDTEIVSEDGRRRSIEEDIANSLRVPTENEKQNVEHNKTILEESHKGKLINTEAIEIHTRQRGITMCEDQSIDMEVHEILQGKEPYQPPSDESPVEEDETTYELHNMHVKHASNSEGLLHINPHDDKNHRIRSALSSSDEVVLNEINSTDLPRNAHLQHIIKPGGSSNSQNISALSPESVVNEIMTTSRLDFVDTQSIQTNSGIVENIIATDQESRNVISKEEALNMIHDQPLLNSKHPTAQDSYIQSKRITEYSLTTEELLEREIFDIGNHNLSEMNINNSKNIENIRSDEKCKPVSSAGPYDSVERNLIDFIVPKNEYILTQATNLNRNDRSNEARQTVTPKNDFATTTKDGAESESSPPKWYVPFESSVQELPDPTRGNSDGLFIALSEETKSPHIRAETATQQHTSSFNRSPTENLNLSPESPQRSWAYIAINGEGNTMDEGWPNHLPKNLHENNESVNSSTTRTTIHEEKTDTFSNEANTQSPVATESVTTSEFTSLIENSRQSGDSNTLREKIQCGIPKFELPNMDRRLLKKRKLNRRQIKSLDSGVHSYYGEYMDLVEFPEIDGGQELKREEAPTTTGEKEENHRGMNTCTQSHIEELEIEEDVVTILPDGTIREEKIVIDKITSS